VALLHRRRRLSLDAEQNFNLHPLLGSGCGWALSVSARADYNTRLRTEPSWSAKETQPQREAESQRRHTLSHKREASRERERLI